MKSAEHDAQVALINWCRMARAEFPDAQRIFAIPNGGVRDIRTAKRLKDEGVRAGVPDTLLPVPRGRWHGLFIEMKVKPNRVSPEQQAELDRLKTDGYFTAVCWSSMEAIQCVKSYLVLAPP